jgi:hypothetical protein
VYGALCREWIDLSRLLSKKDTQLLLTSSIVYGGYWLNTTATYSESMQVFRDAMRELLAFFFPLAPLLACHFALSLLKAE